MSLPGRHGPEGSTRADQGEYRGAQHEGTTVSPPGCHGPERSTRVDQGDCRGAPPESTPVSASVPPATLDHAGIAARVPHAGAMCLLERLLRWDADEIECSIANHADPEHPLRERDVTLDLGLPAPCAIEYAAQAMALHASLHASLQRAAGTAPTPGFLASARDVQLHVPRLDLARGPLAVRARRLAGDERQAMYRFVLQDAGGRALVEGRATVVLNSPLPMPVPVPT